MGALAESRKSAPLNNAHNILILDVERMKGQATVEFWDLGDFKNRRIHADDVNYWPRTICAAWQFYGNSKVEFAAEWETGGRETMLRRTWAAFDQAQIAVGHNIAGFDVKKLRSEWRDAGLPPPSPFKTIDTLDAARREFGDESKTLDALCKRTGVTSKTDRYDVETARAALAGDETAQRRIKAYNVGDIHASREFYDRIRPWLSNHPHSLTGTADDRPTCNACWGDNLERTGTKLAQQITYVLYRCKDCGANVQGTRHSRAAVTRGAR